MDNQPHQSNKISISFDVPELSEDELLSGQILNTLQILMLKRLQAQIANELILIPCANENAMLDAELQGRLRMLQTLLDNSQSAQEVLLVRRPTQVQQTQAPEFSQLFQDVNRHNSSL